MVDKTFDVTRKEPAVLCFRYLIYQCRIVVTIKYPIGFYEVSGTSAKQLFNVMKDVLLYFQLLSDMSRGEDHNHAFGYQYQDNL